ncbi:28S ribosomal protein S31, mitochondrial [Orchesella cincta]|uniref:Small ribosomal subunit protein mS31 n=1 Tax=Orchesella cincta TaxID=48709 RepID=A0A1D2NMA1_ORCCI|nr:28S ribosomal protein S31, mitochondrial [Orchesella cincta]
MHHVRFVIRHGNCFRYSSSATIENALKSSQRLGLRNVSSSHRLLSSKSPDDNNEEGSATSEKKADTTSEKNDRSTKAKAKLDSLLLSIVKDSKEAAEKNSQRQNTIDFKLAAPEKEKPAPKVVEVRPPEEIEAEEDLGKEMVQAVKQVAKSVSAEEDPKVVESELVQKLKTQVGKKINLSDVFAGMKIDRGSKAGPAPYAADKELSRAHRVRRLLDEKTRESTKMRRPSGERMPPQQKRPVPSKPNYLPIDLFGATPLGIFSAKTEETQSETTSEPPKLETWEALHKRDLKLSVTHPPANGFEEMILWTEQGKLWKFPINNEQGLDEESKVPFHEHVFLEPQIEDWCPKRGPIRHFMELVCVGLSKNPFLTVQEKHEQIEWYHQYFKEKATIIKEVGAGEIQ